MLNVDDYPSVQAALDDAPPGATVLVPRGVHRLTAPLQVPDRVTLRGAGVASRLEVAGNISVVRVIGGEGVRLVDLWLHNAATVNTTTAGLVELVGGRHRRVVGCHLTGGRYGVVVRDQSDSYVADNTVLGQAGAWLPVAIYLSCVDGQLRGCVVRGNRVRSVSGAGIMCEVHHTNHQQLSLQITGNHVRGVTDNGIRVQTASETSTSGHVQGGYVISDNTVELTDVDGIRINGYRATVTGNYVSATGGSGIRDGGGGEGTQWTVVRHATITGNTVVNPGASGIVLQNGAHHNTLSGNIMRNCDSYGIYLGDRFGTPSGPYETSIVGNVVDGFSQDGIKVTGPGARDVVISDNTVTGAGRDGVSLRLPAGGSLSGMVVTGNRCRGMQQGLSVHSTHSVVVGNNLRGSSGAVLGDGISSNEVGFNIR